MYPNNSNTFAEARVYAPGMTCVYDQLIQGLSKTEWMAYRFKNDLELYDDPEVVVSNILSGEVEKTATLYQNPDAFRSKFWPRVEYDILAIESRWLMYNTSLLSLSDWPQVEERIAALRDKEVYFFDVGYPHIGKLYDLCAVRTCTPEDLDTWRTRNELKFRLLSLFSKFRKLTYIDATAMAAYLGYQHAYIDQTDHFTTTYRDYFRKIFAEEINDSRFQRNNKTFTRLYKRIEGKNIIINFVDGMHREYSRKDTIISLRIILQNDDPLLCPSQILVSWTTDEDITFDWSKFAVENGILNHAPPIRTDWTVQYVHDVISFNTMGRFTISIME